MKSHTKYDLDLDLDLTFDFDFEKFTNVNIFETSIKENEPKYASILCTGHNLMLASKVKVMVDQEVKFA